MGDYRFYNERVLTIVEAAGTPVNEGTIDRALEWAMMMMRKMKLLSR